MELKGAKVRDRVTGFTGVVVAITSWLAGCERALVQAPATTEENGKVTVPDGVWIDTGQLEVIEAAQPSQYVPGFVPVATAVPGSAPRTTGGGGRPEAPQRPTGR